MPRVDVGGDVRVTDSLRLEMETLCTLSERRWVVTFGTRWRGMRFSKTATGGLDEPLETVFLEAAKDMADRIREWGPGHGEPL